MTHVRSGPAPVTDAGIAYLTPEARARVEIDRMLAAAGWAVQDYSRANLSAARGVAVREFVLKPPHGRADYLLFVDGEAVGIAEAKKEGETLTGVAWQTAKYVDGLPDALPTAVEGALPPSGTARSRTVASKTRSFVSGRKGRSPSSSLSYFSTQLFRGRLGVPPRASGFTTLALPAYPRGRFVCLRSKSSTESSPTLSSGYP